MTDVTKQGYAEYIAEQNLIKEGKTLVTHPKGGKPPYNGGREARALGEKEADGMKLTGVVRKLFLREREEGWIAAGQFEDATEQGLLDELLTPLTGGLVHGPLPGNTKGKTNPTTGRLETENSPSGVESAEKASLSIFNWQTLGEFGVGAVLLLAAAVLFVYGIMVAVRPSGSGLPSPVPKVVPV